MTAAPHAIGTARLWRTTPFSPVAAAETAAIIVVAVIFAGVMAVHARAALQDAQRSAAVSEIKVLGPIISAYGLDNSGYAEMTPAALKQNYELQLDKGSSGTLEITSASASGFCIQIRYGAWYAAQQGPTSAIDTSRSKICR